MSSLIQEILLLGLSSAMYNGINVAGMTIASLYSLYFGKKLQLPIWKTAVIIALLDLVLLVLGSGISELVHYMMDNGFLKIKTPGKCIVRMIVLLPLLSFPLAKLLRIKRSLVCDAMALCPLLNSAISQMACVFSGCCHGYEWEMGIYNIKTNCYHFPVQILETVLTLLIFGYLTSLCKGKKYQTGGSLYPHMMILYGIMRIICEALRDNGKIILGMSEIAVHAAVMMIVGAVWMLILSRNKEKPYGYSIQTLQTQEGEACEGSEGSYGGEGSQV